VIVPDKDAQNNGRSTTCWIRANGIKRYVKEGECLVFDDSFYHDAANESVNQPRLVLLVDIWHPDLSDEEVNSTFIFTIVIHIYLIDQSAGVH
jgi:aspartyl/asparaginyl beta-hydroxylase (cupin superfamily)